MPELQLHLIPTPGAKPEFLATVETSCSSLPFKVVLENYTRDSWAWKPHAAWQSVEMTPSSPKAKEKLTGFLNYLKERQKCAYGRFSPTAVFCISYIAQSATKMTCRFTLDATQVPNCTILKPKKKENGSSAASAQLNTASVKKPQPRPQPQQSSRKKSGILGNLLGAQERTEHHMDATYVKKPKPSTDTTESGSATAQSVLQKFRQTMQQKMLDFDIVESENVLQVKLSLAEITKELVGEENTKVTMQDVKYIVSEQAEEVNEAWVCVTEPSEFMDEVVVSVYKEAPPEVLEEVNQVELPQEVRGQQRAIQEARQKAVAKQEALKEKKLLALATQQDDNLATLNVNKRDRRTIEELQLEMSGTKKAKVDES